MDLKMLNRFVQGRIKDLVFFFGGGGSLEKQTLLRLKLKTFMVNINTHFLGPLPGPCIIHWPHG